MKYGKHLIRISTFGKFFEFKKSMNYFKNKIYTAYFPNRHTPLKEFLKTKDKNMVWGKFSFIVNY